jgi:uncharacterized repeat protein (TIGR02543 family)/LPXTG-motif cell wall-anchored protein
VWEPVDVAGAGLDTLANNSTVTVSFGKAGRHTLAYGNSVGGAFYLTNGECGPSSTPTPCTTSDIDGTVRFTFGAPQTHIKIHYGYVESNDPERVISNLGPVDLRAEGSGGTLVSSTGNLLSAQQAADTFTSGGLIYPSSASVTASGTLELRFSSPGVTFIEFQNDFPDQSSYRSEYGQNLVGLSLPVEYAQVTINANSGSGPMSPQSAARATNLTMNTLTYSGYTFAGWNTAANGTGAAFADGASFAFSADTVLYAQWTPIAVASPTPSPAATISSTNVQEPATTSSLLASTGSDNSQAVLIGGAASLMTIAGLVIVAARRRFKQNQ